MALVLLVCAVLMIRTFQQLRRVDPGFTDAPSLQTLQIAIPESSIADPRMVTRVENNIADKLASIPGVTSAGFARIVPMEGVEPGWSVIFVEGKTYEGDRADSVLQLRLPGLLSGSRHSPGRGTRFHLE